MNKFIFIFVLIIILAIIYYFTHINNYANKELFESEQELNQNDEIEQDSSSYSLFIIFSVIVLCMCCSVIYYFNTNTPIPELLLKKQLEQISLTNTSGLTNTSDSSKPYIIIVQPSIVPVNQSQPFSANPSNMSYPSNISNPMQIPNTPIQVQNTMPNNY